MRRTSLTTLVALACAFGPVHARAATISGRISDLSGAGLAGVEVRLWFSGPPAKSLGVAATVTTAGDGAFSFDGPAPGEYRIDARMGPTLAAHYADRWYDSVEPFADGWLRESADVLPFDGSSDVSGVGILMIEQGSLTGRILNGDGSVSQDVVVRVELNEQLTYNHVGATRRECCVPTEGFGGRWLARGLRALPDYRVFLHDATGVHETEVVMGPFGVTSGTTTEVGDWTLTPGPADPYEPNDAATEAGTDSIDASVFRGPDRGAFVTLDARIAPRNEDIDWYCLEAEANDRFYAYTTTSVFLAGTFDDNPYVDPVVSFWTGDGTILLTESDDADGYGLNPLLDTGLIPTTGRYCFVTSTYGDTTWTGTNQGSAGRYTLIVEMGNRSPTFEPTISGSALPEPPGRAIISEGSVLTVDLNVVDLDGDPLTITYEVVDADGNPNLEPTIDATVGSERFLWDPSDTAGLYAPYTVQISVADAEFAVSAAFMVDVRSVNVIPFVPTPIAPIGGVSVDVDRPALVVENSSDPDGDSLIYEFEVHYGTPSAAPDELGEIAEDLSGTTSFTVVNPIPEDQHVSWRVRARDGFTIPGYSAWSDFETFVVNAANEPPTAPALVKPDDGEIVLSRSPALSATNSEDPDGDIVSLIYEVATDRAFAEIVVTSEPVPQNVPAGRTTWAVDPPLEWDQTYFARVTGRDAQGALSDPSAVRQFSVKANTAPDPPMLGGVFQARCEGAVITDAAPTELVVPPVDDVDRGAVTIELRVDTAGASLDSDEPLFHETKPQVDDTPTVFVVSTDLFEENGGYVVSVRASDGDMTTAWTSCDFVLNLENTPPGELAITAPVDGSALSSDVASVDVFVRNATDPDGADAVQIVWCAALQGQVCPEDRSAWIRVDQDPSGQTVIPYSGFAAGDTVTFSAAARDSAGALGPTAVATFSIDGAVATITPTLCACSATAPPATRAVWGLGALLVLGLARRRPRRVATRAGLLLGALLALSSRPAAAGPWIPPAGSGYAQLGHTFFAAQDGTRDGASTSLQYRAHTTTAYAELALTDFLLATVSVPWVAATHRSESTEVRYRNRSIGDVRAALDVAPIGDVPLTLGAEMKVPAYRDPADRDAADGLPDDLYDPTLFPVVGDDNVDLTARAQVGSSLYPVPGWIQAQLGYRWRGRSRHVEIGARDHADQLVATASVGVDLVAERLQTELFVAGGLPVQEAGGQTITGASTLYLQGKIAVYPSARAPFALRGGVGGVPIARAASRGYDVSVGTSFAF